MARKPNPEFGKRRPVVPAVPLPPDPPSKRSSHVALLVMGTLAVGGGAYALMPRQNCQPVQPTPPGVTTPGGAVPQPGADCAPRGSSSGSGARASHEDDRRRRFRIQFKIDLGFTSIRRQASVLMEI